jgi:hypothetical protein
MNSEKPMHDEEAARPHPRCHTGIENDREVIIDSGVVSETTQQSTTQSHRTDRA